MGRTPFVWVGIPCKMGCNPLTFGCIIFKNNARIMLTQANTKRKLNDKYGNGADYPAHESDAPGTVGGAVPGGIHGYL